MSKHTPGPWSGGVREIIGPKGETIAGLSGYKNETESVANARLIASAPELLEALKTIIENQTSDEKMQAEFGGYIIGLEEKRIALAAIAKAEGKS